MPEKERTNPAVNIPGRQLRQELLRQLRLEEEGKSIAGYADYLQKMEALDRRIEELSVRDQWGVTKPVDAAMKEELQKAILDTARAGEQYMKNVREAKKDANTGVPGVVNKLQGLLSGDLLVLNNYDPSQLLSLPQLLESARAKTLLLGNQEMDRLGGAQNSRIPLSLESADGKKCRAVYTRATYADLQHRIDRALKRARDSEECTEKGKEQLDKLYENMRAFAAKNNPDFANLDNSLLFLYVAEQFTTTRGKRSYFNPVMFGDEMGIDVNEVGWDNLISFGHVIEKIQESTSDSINTVSLRVKEGARIDSRSSAMSAVATLFGRPQLLARSSNMRFVDQKGRTLEGTVMDFSDGIDLNREYEVFKQVSDDPFSGPDQDKLLKQIADLQVIDYVCGNIDRHAGNLMYLTDDNGKITGIQGIDNDSSFANRYTGKENYNRLVGTDNMNCITKSMADKILNMDASMLKFTLRGRGLSEAELSYSVRRLSDLKKAIKDGKEHYKNHPKIDKNTEKPFDKGFIRTVSDEEFKALRMDKMVTDENQENLFSEVSNHVERRLRRAREEGCNYDPEAKKNAEKEDLKLLKTEGQTYTGQNLLRSIKGASDLVKKGDFDIDNLTDGWHGTSTEFDEMAAAAKEMARLEQELAEEMQRRQESGQLHFSAVEYNRLQAPVEEARNTLREKTENYLYKKMGERKARSMEELVGKNPYERARIDHAKKLFDYTETHKVPSAVPDKILGQESGEGLELRINTEMSTEEEALAAKKMLEAIHKQHGLEAPEKFKDASAEELNKAIENAQKM